MSSFSFTIKPGGYIARWEGFYLRLERDEGGFHQASARISQASALRVYLLGREGAVRVRRNESLVGSAVRTGSQPRWPARRTLRDSTRQGFLARHAGKVIVGRDGAFRRNLGMGKPLGRNTAIPR